MKKEGLFVILAVLALGAIFFSFISSMNYSGYAVKDMSSCLAAKNRFDSFKIDSNCVLKTKEGVKIESCQNGDEMAKYEYSPSEFKRWSFLKEGEKEEYIYYLKTKECKKG